MMVIWLPGKWLRSPNGLRTVCEPVRKRISQPVRCPRQWTLHCSNYLRRWSNLVSWWCNNHADISIWWVTCTKLSWTLHMPGKMCIFSTLLCVLNFNIGVLYSNCSASLIWGNLLQNKYPNKFIYMIQTNGLNTTPIPNILWIIKLNVSKKKILAWQLLIIIFVKDAPLYQP